MSPIVCRAVFAFLCLVVTANAFNFQSFKPENLKSQLADAISKGEVQVANKDPEKSEPEQKDEPAEEKPEEDDTSPSSTVGKTDVKEGSPFGQIFVFNEDKKDNTTALTKGIGADLDKLNATVQELVDQYKSIGECDCAAIDPAVKNTNELAALKSTFHSYKDDCTQLSTSYATLKKSVTSVSGDAGGSGDTGSKFEGLFTSSYELRTRIDNLTDDIDTFEQSVIDKTKIDRLNTDVTTASNKIPELNDKLSSWYDDHSTASHNMPSPQSMKTSLSDFADKVSTIEDDAEAVTSQDLERLENSLDGIDSTIGTNIDQGTADYTDIRQRLDSLAKDVDSIHKEAPTLTQSVKEQIISGKKMQEKFHNINEASSNYENQLSNSMASLEAMKDDVQASLRSKNTGSNSVDIETPKQKAATLEKTMDKLTASVSEMSRDATKHIDAMNDLAKSLSKLDVSGDIDALKDSEDDYKRRLADAKDKVFVRCPSSWSYSSATNLCYAYNKIKSDWYTAFSRCKVLGGPTARLAVLNSMAKLKVIANDLKKKGDTSDYMVGMFSKSLHNSWPSFAWIGGEDQPRGSTLWQKGEPNHQGVACGNLWIGYSWYYTGHRLDDVPCDSNIMSVCEIPMK